MGFGAAFLRLVPSQFRRLLGLQASEPITFAFVICYKKRREHFLFAPAVSVYSASNFQQAVHALSDFNARMP